MVFFSYALLMMVSYYILKTIREPLLLATSSAEIKSYAYAVTAGLLLIIIPIYGLVFRHSSKRQLTRIVTLFFLVNLGVFYLLGRSGVGIGFAYYVWVGVYNVLITAQFWAFAADSYNVKSGQRLFPIIMVGATAGSLAAPYFSGIAFPVVGPWVLMLVAMFLLALTLPLVSRGRAAIPPGSRGRPSRTGEENNGGWLSGMSFVFSDRYLFLLAMLILLLNWVNTTGEYILSELVVRYADARVLVEAGASKSDIIASFYGNFFFAVNTLTLLIQVFLVARIIRWIGIRGAILILPIVAMIGYGMVVFIPIFSIIRVVKILENSTDYSLMNTVRHALYLPLSAAKKYEGKTAIDGFFWRFGDLLQAGAIYLGLNVFHFEIEHFAALNMVLAAVWIWVAWQISRYYTGKEKLVTENQPPQLTRALEEQVAPHLQTFSFELPGDTFTDPDEGDVLVFAARQAGKNWLPLWLDFDSEELRFSGIPPVEAGAETQVVIRATDFAGAWIEGKLTLRHAAQPATEVNRVIQD